MDEEMPLPNNAADVDLESDRGFVRNCGRMSAFEREYSLPNKIMPERPLSAVFAVNQTSESSVKDIFQGLQNIGIPAHGVRCLQRVSNDRFCITFGKENYRNAFLKKSSFIPYLTNGRPRDYLLHRTWFMLLPTTHLSKCLMKLSGIVSAGSTSYVLLVAANFRPCPVFSTEFVFLVWRYLNLSLRFCVLGDTLFA